MAKDRYYFDHDYHARNDDKILELRAAFGAEGYGVFWMLVETMAEKENGGVSATLLGGLAHGFGVAKGRLQEVVDKCIEIGLFYEDGGCFFSERMLQHKNFRKSLSIAGKKGAEARSSSKPPLSPPSTIKGKEYNTISINSNKNKEDTLKEEGMGETKGFNKKPLASDFNGLPEINTNQVIEFVGITKQHELSKNEVALLWEIFKTKNLTGENYYASESKVYGHFLDSMKYQVFAPTAKNETQMSDYQKSIADARKKHKNKQQ